MMNLTKFPFILILIMITSSVFSEEIFLDCILDFDIHEIDIDFDNRSGKWVPYTSKFFTENASDPQYGLFINQNTVRFGKMPSDYIEIDLKTLRARAVIAIGMQSDTLAGGMEDDRLSGGIEDDSLSGGMQDDSLSGGMESDTLAGGMESDTLAGGMESDTLAGGMEDDRLSGGMQDDSLSGGMQDDSLSGGMQDDSLSGGMQDDSLAGGMEDDSLTAGFQEGVCEIVPQRLRF